MRLRHFIGILLVAVCAGCEGGAVVFAPTPLPPDTSPLTFQHPGGAFSVSVPREWSVYTQNAAALASAAFTPPGAEQPAVIISVANLGTAVDVLTFINTYQQSIRPDADHYAEQDRQAMGDGSWRLTGLRQRPDGQIDAVNTFIEQAGTFIAVTDITLPSDDPSRLTELETIANTVQFNAPARLQVTGPEIFASAAYTALQVVNVTTWETASGVFFITGEVANHSGQPVPAPTVRAGLYDAGDQGIIEAADTTMGYAIRAGGFAPFSLRFGQGQPSNASAYIITVEAADLDTPIIISGGALTWTDVSSRTPEGHLVVEGTLTNTSDQPARAPLAIITVFDEDGGVIAAGFITTGQESIAAGESVPYLVRVPEMGGIPANYILDIQALP